MNIYFGHPENTTDSSVKRSKTKYNLTPTKEQDREILPEGVGDFPVLHFLRVFDFISHFISCF
jgi:hypothetical protein